MKTLRKVLETITEKLLMASGYITSITIILMVVFLFREGAGLFNTPDIEEGYVLAVNRENPVQKLSPQQVMQVFDGDIASWGTLGWGGGDSIRLFRLDGQLAVGQGVAIQGLISKYYPPLHCLELPPSCPLGYFPGLLLSHTGHDSQSELAVVVPCVDVVIKE